jgi:hypothetical protein
MKIKERIKQKDVQYIGPLQIIFRNNLKTGFPS